jgi:nicotinamidase-related amidase
MQANTIARRDDSMLIIIDEQERLTAAMERRDPDVAATVRLVRAAALVGVPIIVTRQYPKGLGDLDPALAQALDAAQASGLLVSHVDKVAFDCFHEPDFGGAVAIRGKQQLIVAGMETHICVTQTVLAALRAGYDVHVAADACCSREQAHHEVALLRMRGAEAVVTTSESVMYEWVGEAGTEEFRELLGIVKD